MKKNVKHDELQSRREFFKKAAKGMLPMLGAIAFGPMLITSCGPDDSDEFIGCTDCTSVCSSNCSTTCTSTCKDDCRTSSSNSSDNGNCSDCASSCSASSASSTCSSCANDCSSSCKETCKTTCSNISGGSATGKNDVSSASGKIDGYEYVDLGLSVKWARYNFGAQKPEDYGKLVAAGDASGSGEKKSFYALTAPEIEDGDSICGNSKYDVATSQWSKKWRLPSKKNLDELLENTSFECISLNDVKGVKFVSKKNGNSIFMPFAGEEQYTADSTYENVYIGKYGFYWTGDIKELVGSAREVARFKKYILSMSDSYTRVSTFAGSALASVRPVTTGTGSGGGGCTGSSCSSNCANNSTGGGCTGCGSGCSTSCKTNCEGSCINGCNTLCGGQCRYSCGGSCTYVSAGSKCTGCATSCMTYCYRTCDMACSSSCMSQCIYTSK